MRVRTPQSFCLRGFLEFCRNVEVVEGLSNQIQHADANVFWLASRVVFTKLNSSNVSKLPEERIKMFPLHPEVLHQPPHLNAIIVTIFVDDFGS